ncbi:hypothetical protein JD844_033299 [Phrynosoma platyrhinos]|uniref:Vitelline membrane outer layer protein 1 n=1 Tax=Phrynosoma platyrhinos TaxID=52577 RepID=A0ABQ7T6D8_PHRPL|nr:hypothetical protein JD844_033299 [Phrynosoma platyrhinos]
MWSNIMTCPQGNLISFSLNVEAPMGMGDDTAANNIQFSCTDGTIVKNKAKEWGKYGDWSKRCPAGGICGIQTKVEPVQEPGKSEAEYFKMDLSNSIVIFLIFSCCVWDTESRSYNAILTVSNGGKWGDWGKEEFCPEGYARAFSIKAQKKQGIKDDTGLNGIRLECESGAVIESTVGKEGKWSRIKRCPEGNLNSFTLNVEPPKGAGDDTAANNIQFTCTDGTVLKGEAKEWGKYGDWSKHCPAGGICGIQTKVEAPKKAADNTGLNDVQFYCCE